MFIPRPGPTKIVCSPPHTIPWPSQGGRSSASRSSHVMSMSNLNDALLFDGEGIAPSNADIPSTNPGVESTLAFGGHTPGLFIHEHRGGDNPGIVFQCTGKFKCHFDSLNDRFWNAKNMLLGEILTIVDAIITDERQNKATKDLVKNRIIMGFCDFQQTLEMLLGTAMIHPQKMQKRTENSAQILSSKSQ